MAVLFPGGTLVFCLFVKLMLQVQLVRLQHGYGELKLLAPLTGVGCLRVGVICCLDLVETCPYLNGALVCHDDETIQL
jgi:hypothetical protein